MHVMVTALLLSLLVYQSGMGFSVLLAVTIALLLSFLVCQLGTGLDVLLAVTIPLMLPGCDGHGSLSSISSWSYKTL
jgi:hypothetical protein